MLTEELINRQLDGLIQETSGTESGADFSGFRTAGRSGRRSDRSFKGSPGRPKKGKVYFDNLLPCPKISHQHAKAIKCLKKQPEQLAVL